MEVIYYGGPTAVIFPQKCARQHFQIADGRENTGKSRQMESKIRSTGRGIHFRRNMQKIDNHSLSQRHEDIDGVAARGLVNGRSPPAAGGIYRQYPHVSE